MNKPLRTVLWERLRSEWRLKVLLQMTLFAFFCLGYFTLQRLVFFPVRSVTESWFDRAVPFQPGWVYAYQSIYLLMPIAPWLSASRRELSNYSLGLIAMSTAAFLIFLLFPVAAPRPDVIPTDGLYGLLVTYDTKLNAFPSLHVGLTVYTILFGYALLRQASARVRRAYLLVTGAWAAVICYSTLATKQHFAVDLPAGALLAVAAHAWAWRRRRNHQDVTEGATDAPLSRRDGLPRPLVDPLVDEPRFGTAAAAAGSRPRAAPGAEGGI